MPTAGQPEPAHALREQALREARLFWPSVRVAVGTGAEIPRTGDVLPYTIGDVGIHVERLPDGGLAARMNRAQRGGCGVIPVQCQTGMKIRCPQIACGFSQDSVAVVTDADPERERHLFQLIGSRPDRLAQVTVTEQNGLILVSLRPYPEAAVDLPGTGGQAWREGRWVHLRANWKQAARHLARIGADGWTAEYGFPNLIVLVRESWRCVLILQPLGPDSALCRASLFGPKLIVPPSPWAALAQACAAAERAQAGEAQCWTGQDPAAGLIGHVADICAAQAAHDRPTYQLNPRYGFAAPGWHV